MKLSQKGAAYSTMDAFVERLPKDDDVLSTQQQTTATKVEEPARPAKRVKKEVIPDSEDEDDEEISQHAFGTEKVKVTDVENALPSVDDEDALEEYEAIKSSQNNKPSDDGTTVQTRPLWMKGRSSIYVDAFNLALDTVLDEESHLFDDKEKEVFAQWKQLDYETQFM